MGFSSRNDYKEFSNTIRSKNRFAFSPEARTFLREFQEQAKNRLEILPEGNTLYRCVKDYNRDEDEGYYRITGSSKDRILPNKKYAFEGRANPNGIVYLYLASSKITAISEVRPWVGELVTIAKFKTCRELRLADLSKGHGKSRFDELSFDELWRDAKISQDKVDRCVWNEIDNAFSKPTSKTDTGAEYAPTQILAESLKEDGYDGIIYKSAFGGEKGYNVMLFDLNDANILTSDPFHISGIEVTFEPF